MERYVQKYRKAWESDPSLKKWIRPLKKDDTKAMCVYCKYTIIAKRTDLLRHTESANHIKAMKYNLATMSIDIERLIAMVRAKPPLWDQKNKHYHNRHIVDRLWNETAAALNQKTIAIKKKWKSLRDQFRTELKKIPPERYDELGPHSCFENMPQWPHFKPLLFIKEHMKTRKVMEQLHQHHHQPLSLEESSYVENDDNDSNEKNEKYCVQSGLDLFEVETLSTSQEAREINKPPSDEHLYSDRISSKKRKRDHNAKPVVLRSDEDEDIAFFVSLLPHVRRMDPARKLLCRMEIQNSVYNHAYRNGRSVPETVVREATQFSENILSTEDPMQLDSKEHVFFQHHNSNND